MEAGSRRTSIATWRDLTLTLSAVEVLGGRKPWGDLVGCAFQKNNNAAVCGVGWAAEERGWGGRSWWGGWVAERDPDQTGGCVTPGGHYSSLGERIRAKKGLLWVNTEEAGERQLGDPSGWGRGGSR